MCRHSRRQQSSLQNIAAVALFQHLVSMSTHWLCTTAAMRTRKQVRVFLVLTADFDTDTSARKLLATTEAYAFGVCGGLLSGLPAASDNPLLPCPTAYGCRRNSQNYWQCFPGATVVQPYVAPVASPPPPPSPPPASPPPPPPSPPPATPVANHTTTGELAPYLGC